MVNTIKQLDEHFNKTNYSANDMNSIHWVCLNDLAVIDKTQLWRIFHAAMPYGVKANKQHQDNLEVIYEWLYGNTHGLWTNTKLLFVFQKQEDATAFKLRWS